MLVEEHIIQGCLDKERTAQKKLFDKYASVMLALCMRYARNRAEAEDILQDGFLKIFLNMKQYSGKGSFEGWMKRIMINTAISSYRTNLKHYFHNNIDEINEIGNIDEHNDDEPENDFSAEELMKIINDLPDGYRIVFNMHVIEGYKHKEIAEELNIDVGTSKSQFARARQYIQKKLKEAKKSVVAE